jgi:hypothetical protein
MNEECTTARTDTRSRVEETAPGRYSIKFAEPLTSEESAEFLRLMEAACPQFTITDMIEAQR